MKTFVDEDTDIRNLREMREHLLRERRNPRRVTSYLQRYLMVCTDEELLELSGVKPKERNPWMKDRLAAMETAHAWRVLDAAGLADEALSERNAMRRVLRERELTEEEARRGEGVSGEQMLRSARAAVMMKMRKRHPIKISQSEMKRMCKEVHEEYKRMGLS